MEPLTLAQLMAVMPHAFESRAQLFLPYLNEYMPAFAINSTKRASAFLATVAEESGELQYTRELWGPTEAQQKYEPPGEKADELGNTEPGDGQRYKGRGLIQITGRANYAAVSKDLGIDFLGDPVLMQQPEYATQTACWWWQMHGCNELADVPDFEAVTRRVNGGLTHYNRRLAYYNAALTALRGASA